MDHKIHIYYGNGKGKTTACTGLAVRALGAGLKVAVLYFDKGHKGGKEHYSERNILREIEGCEVIPTGCERMMDDGEFRFGVLEEDRKEAERALSIAKTLIQSGDQDLFIMDEILAAVAYKMVTRKEVMSILDLYNENRRCELVLSGHKVWKDLTEAADLITRIKKEKHYYDTGLQARVGIDI